jgi:hypothetical protein
MVGSGCGRHDHIMRVAIRCHPCAPVGSAEVEEWLEAAVAKVRDSVAEETRVHVLRLSQRLPSGREVIGWLVELDGGDDSIEPDITSLVRDMRLLGLGPTVLAGTGTASASDIAGSERPECRPTLASRRVG